MREHKSECPKGQFGPIYNVSGLERWRRLARDGLKTMTADDRAAYGQAVEDRIKAMQLAALRREVSLPRPCCAGGTWINTNNGAIGAAIRAKQNAALLSARSRIADLEPYQLEAEYLATIRALRGEDYAPSWQREDLEAQCAANPEAVANELLEKAA